MISTKGIKHEYPDYAGRADRRQQNVHLIGTRPAKSCAADTLLLIDDTTTAFDQLSLSSMAYRPSPYVIIPFTPQLVFPNLRSTELVSPSMFDYDWRDEMTPENLLDLKMWRESPIYRRIRNIKRHYGAHPAVEAKFQQNRNRSYGSKESTHTSAQQFFGAFRDINATMNNAFGEDRVRRFLDLGCAPGGFSSWLLYHNPSSIGLGITLPDGLGLDEISPTMAARYRLEFCDILTIDPKSVNSMALPSPDNATGRVLTSQSFDLIVAGAFPTLGQVSPMVRVGLALSQLLIVIMNLDQGGSALVVINTKPFEYILAMIAILDEVFERVIATKGKALHGVRSSCYLACTGFRATAPEISCIIGRLQTALKYLQDIPENLFHIEGADKDDMTVTPTKQEVLRVGGTLDDFAEQGHEKCRALFEPMWEAQARKIFLDFAEVLYAQEKMNDLQIRPPVSPQKLITPPESPKSPTSPWRSRSVISQKLEGRPGASFPSKTQTSPQTRGPILWDQSPASGWLRSPPPSPTSPKRERGWSVTKIKSGSARDSWR